MTRPTTRVLALLELLQTQRHSTGPELARRLQVEPRTLRRYITVLEDLGIPISTERGRYGGYTLAPGYKMPPLMFTDEETLAVSLGLVAARRLGLGGDGPTLESLQAKLERVMPAPLKERLRALSERADLDMAAPAAAVNSAALVALAGAAQAGRRVRLDYRSDAGQASAREVDPYALVMRRGHWYLSGLCHLRGGLRSFRLDRVEAVEALAAGFERPADFDGLAHLNHSIARLPRATPVAVLLHCPMPRAVEELGSEIGVFVPQADGVLLHARTDSLAWFARQLVRLPFRFEIHEPAELRSAVRAFAQRVLQNVPEEAAAPVPEIESRIGLQPAPVERKKL